MNDYTLTLTLNSSEVLEIMEAIRDSNPDLYTDLDQALEVGNPDYEDLDDPTDMRAPVDGPSARAVEAAQRYMGYILTDFMPEDLKEDGDLTDDEANDAYMMVCSAVANAEDSLDYV